MWDGVSAVQFISSFECARQPNTGSRRVLGKSKQESEKQARFYLDKVGLAEKAGSYPDQLSGGQKQR